MEELLCLKDGWHWIKLPRGKPKVAVCHVRGGKNSSSLCQADLWQDGISWIPDGAMFPLVCLWDALTQIAVQLEAPSNTLCPDWHCDVWEVSSGDLHCGVAQLLRDSSLGVSWARRAEFGCACGWDPADLLWLTQSCSSIYWKCRGACVGDVWAAPSWSGREISPECGFAAYLQEPGEGKPQLPAKCRRAGDSALWVNPSADSSCCTFCVPGFCG